MQLYLDKPLVCFDLETTGLSIIHDRIIEISLLKIFPDNKEKHLTKLLNPGKPIPEEATEIHGITNEDVADKPPFSEIAVEILDFIKNADLAGYNVIRFDIPFLAEELLRAGISYDFKKIKIIDVQNIFHKLEPRNLVAAYKFYCNKELKQAHSAKADTQATYEVLKAQLDKYDELENNVSILSNFSTMHHFVDLAGFITRKGKQIILNFGKYKNMPLETLIIENPGYINWILQSEFPAYTKQVIRDLKATLEV